MTTYLTRAGLVLVLSAGLVVLAGGCAKTDAVAEHKDEGKGTEKTEPVATKITAPEMDCPTCAKKVETKLGAVPGVAKVEINVDDRLVTVTPQPGATLSPKALWEATVAGGQEPSKLEGPSGVFTSVPAQ